MLTIDAVMAAARTHRHDLETEAAAERMLRELHLATPTLAERALLGLGDVCFACALRAYTSYERSRAHHAPAHPEATAR
jgi:hypothetical protein